jgi:hypothetical protein
MAKVSVIISARGERHLPRMLFHLLSRLTGDFEILIGLDGGPYPPEREFPIDDRLKVFAFEYRGLKPTINHLASVATGDYLLKFDAHCAVSEGLDEIIQRDVEPNWMVVPRFYTLDEDTWEPNINKPYNDYWCVSCPLTDPRGYRFQASGYWFERTKERNDITPFDESMTHHGSCWFTSRKFFLEDLKGMTSEGYGVSYMEPADLGFRTWVLGGKVMCRKDCSYSHLHQNAKDRGYGISMREINRSYLWTANHWMRRPEFALIVDKFMPIPSWPDNWRDLQNAYERANPL